MAKNKLKIACRISYNSVKEAYDKEKDGRIKQRLLIVLKAYEEKSSYKIAEEVKVDHTKVLRWVKRFNEYGFEGLADLPRSGKPSLMKESQKETLKKLLDNKSEFRAGFNSVEVLEIIERNFKITYTLGHVRKILHILGYNLITPRNTHINKDPIKNEKIVEKLKKN